MANTQKSRSVRKGGMAYAEPEMDYEQEEEPEEDDLSDLLDEEPEEDEMPDEHMDDESEVALAAEVDNLYKALDQRDTMILQLAKATRTLAKRVMALEDEDEDEDESSTDRKVDEQAPESDFAVGGDDDLGAPEAYQDGESETPGLTEGQPQGIAQKAFRIAKSLHAQGVPMSVIGKATGLVLKDDKWSNFGEKDADVPANAPVTPDTKDWADDFSVVPGSGQAPASVKGVGSVAKSLGVSEAKVSKALAAAGFIKKSRSPSIGTPPQNAQAFDAEELAERARGLSFSELNRVRTGLGDL